MYGVALGSLVVAAFLAGLLIGAVAGGFVQWKWSSISSKIF